MGGILCSTVSALLIHYFILIHFCDAFLTCLLFVCHCDCVSVNILFNCNKCLCNSIVLKQVSAAYITV